MYVSAAQGTPSHSILHFLFSSVVCGVFRRILRQHDSAILTTPKASLQGHDESISTTLRDLAMLRNMAVTLPWMVPSHQTTLSRIADPQTIHKKTASTAFDCENAWHLQCVSTIIVGLLQWFYDMKTRF